LISISANGALMFGSGSLVFLQVEAIGSGDTGITFDKGNLHIVAVDGREVVLELDRGLRQ
ncbi:MAG TPA: hypothetical protein VEW46_08735, partial [Pyrinomonadaceae bacterium]|nr:hypothetical protein [Pyrinomonadaceae bacterium]